MRIFHCWTRMSAGTLITWDLKQKLHASPPIWKSNMDCETIKGLFSENLDKKAGLRVPNSNCKGEVLHFCFIIQFCETLVSFC